MPATKTATPERVVDLGREHADAWRALPKEEQPWLIVCFGMLDYWTLSAHTERAVAESELAWWQHKASSPGGLALLPISRHISKHDFQIRQQWDLDDLTAAIHSSY
jgi:hypothetical protein